MTEYKLLRPEICQHRVDQQPKFFADDGKIFGMRQNWCLDCLRGIDVKTAFAALEAIDLDRPADR